MFGIPREDLVEGLGRIQKKLCAYTRQPRDCKYGATRAGEGSETGSGCPEVTMALRLIAALTPTEFARACRRAHIHI